MATTLSDGGLLRGSYVLALPDSGNVNANVNVLFKTFKFNQSVKSSFEFDANGLPLASSHVRDFKKVAITFMAYNGVNAPAQMVKFGPVSLFDGVNTNYAILNMERDGGTEALKSFTADLIELVN